MRPASTIVAGRFHGAEIEPGTFHGAEIEPGTFHGSAPAEPGPRPEAVTTRD